VHHKVYLIDVTNGDGVQTSRILLPKPSKSMLKPLADDELRLIASYTDVVRKILTVNL
jgi:hypothetical protein